jgi:cytoskeletal protein RodZ
MEEEHVYEVTLYRADGHLDVRCRTAASAAAARAQVAAEENVDELPDPVTVRRRVDADRSVPATADNASNPTRRAN